MLSIARLRVTTSGCNYLTEDFEWNVKGVSSELECGERHPLPFCMNGGHHVLSATWLDLSSRLVWFFGLRGAVRGSAILWLL